MDQRLFLPEPWLTEAYAARRTTCQGPEDLTFHPKPQLAVAIWRDMHQEELLAFKYMVADCLDGHSPEFIEAAEPCGGQIACVSMPSATRCWSQGPVPQPTRDTYTGEARAPRVGRPTAKVPLAVHVLATSIHECFWYRRKGSEGTKGPRAYEFTKRQVRRCQDSLPDQAVWLVMKRTSDENPTDDYSISNAPVRTRFRLFVWRSGMRWAMEPCFEETKTALGLDPYEISKYPGWHHHLLTGMLAPFFLWHMNIRLGQKSPSAYSVAAEDSA